VPLDHRPVSPAHENDARLAELMRQQRALLVLDELEPLPQPTGAVHRAAA
jgi:hypothetical protein